MCVPWKKNVTASNANKCVKYNVEPYYLVKGLAPTSFKGAQVANKQSNGYYINCMTGRASWKTKFDLLDSLLKEASEDINSFLKTYMFG